MNQQKPSRDMIDIVFDFLIKQCEKLVELITNFLMKKRNEKKQLDTTVITQPEQDAAVDDEEEVIIEPEDKSQNV